MNKTHATLLVVLIVVSLVGLGDSAYLSAEHFQGSTPVCTIGEVTLGNCGTVLSSQYAEVFGIPTALAGALYYVLVFVLLLAYTQTRKRELLSSAVVLTGLGFLATAWFVYLQLFVLNAICVFCMVSAVSTTILFVSLLYLYFSTRGSMVSEGVVSEKE